MITTKANRSFGLKRRFTTLLVSTLAVILSGCSGAGADAGNGGSGGSGGTAGDYVSPSQVTPSLTGGIEVSANSLQQISSLAIDPDNFYQDGTYEYSEFIVVPEVAHNFNGRFGPDSFFARDVAVVLAEDGFSNEQWQPTDMPEMFQMIDGGDIRLFANESKSHYRLVMHNGSDSTEWLEVRESAEYKRTIWLQEFTYDSIDMVELTEFDDYVFTRSIRFFDRYKDDGSFEDSFFLQAFAGIHRSSDPSDQVMGVLQRFNVDTTTTPWTFTEDESQRAVAAFDRNQLMIRPDPKPDVFLFPSDQFYSYEDAGGGLGGPGYEPYDGPNALGPQVGETFNPANFVMVDSGVSFLSLGLLPEHVAAVSILGVSLDDLNGNAILDFPDWERSDVTVQMGP
jgi:hypothetical protein